MIFPESFLVSHKTDKERMEIEKELIRKCLVLKTDWFPSRKFVVLPDGYGFGFLERVPEFDYDEFMSKIKELDLKDSGELIVYKKSSYFKDGIWKQAIIKLRIPKKAKRIMSFNKCRAEYVEVLDIRNLRNFKIDCATSPYIFAFKYRVGSIIYSQDIDKHKFFDERPLMCAPGIHFFRTYKEAKEYEF